MKWSLEATNGITLSRAKNILQHDQAMQLLTVTEPTAALEANSNTGTYTVKKMEEENHEGLQPYRS